MTWLRDLVLGFFTRHLGAKLLALLLSLGLFGFVQSQLTGTREVARLELRFTLADELKNQWILVTDKIIFQGLTMTGMRGKVDPLAKTSSLTLPIDQRILSVYGKTHADGTAIPIDAALFRDEVLFGKEITVGGLPGDVALVVNALDSRQLRVEVAPQLREVTHRDYEGRLVFALNVKTVKVEGPKSAFVGADPTILVTVRRIQDEISRYQLPGESGVVKLSGVCEVLWTDGGIKSALVPLLRITADELSGDPIPAKEFPQRIVASSQEVTKRKEVVKRTMIPIEIRYPVPRKFDLVVDYVVFSPFTDAELSEGKVRELDVRMPAGLTGNEDFLSNLIVVLDVSAARSDLDRLKVPFYLDLKDRSREEDLASLRQVDLVIPEALAEFGLKKP